MKKSIFLAISVLFVGLTQSHAQYVEGSQWKSFFAGRINDTATLSFKKDTSIITSSNGSELVRSVFHISHDTLSINDIGGEIACLDGAGLYTFTNPANILKLKVISDPCEGRSSSLSGREWIKVKKQ